MSRTRRKDKNGKVYNDGKPHTFMCRCEYCVGKNNAVDKAHKKTIKEQIKCLYCGDDIGTVNPSHHLRGWCVL